MAEKSAIFVYKSTINVLLICRKISNILLQIIVRIMHFWKRKDYEFVKNPQWPMERRKFMKQEANKKSKKWLWLVISLAAVLVVAGAVLAFVLPGLLGDNSTDAVTSDLYWNLDGAYYLSISDTPGFSAREPAEDGNYYVRFAVNGQVEELQIADKQLVNYIDSMDLMGLVFDADGIIVDALRPKDIATEHAKDFYVQKVDGNELIINSSMAMNGMELNITLSENTNIYDVAPDAEQPGMSCEVQVMDRISAYGPLDSEEITHLYVVEHPEDAGIY